VNFRDRRPHDLVIGVDVGGTKTTAWVGETDSGPGDSPVAAGHAGPGNPRDVGFESSFREISAAIERALSEAGSTAPPIVLCMSVAGAGRPVEQEHLRQWALSRRIARRVIVTGDAEPILAAASPNNVGLVLISGTGSLAWGRAADGRVKRVGGWGYLFGDGGSGYAIAAAGLHAAAHAADGRGEQTLLLEAMMDQFDATAPDELIERVYGSAATRKRIARSAQVVFEIATCNDCVARRILEQASAELAGMVTTLSQKLGFRTTTAVLALAGGILMNQAEFRLSVVSQIGMDPNLTFDVPCPAAGALVIARNAAIQ